MKEEFSGVFHATPTLLFRNWSRRTRENNKKDSYNDQCHGLDLNRVPPEYKTDVTDELTCSLIQNENSDMEYNHA